MPVQSEQMNIRITDSSKESTVDAEVLARILQGIQRAVYIVAMDEGGHDPATPSYVPQSVQKNYPVRCLVPQHGSYALPLLIGNVDDLVVPEAARQVLDKIINCLKGVLSSDCAPFMENIRNGRLRVQLLDAFRSIFPKPGATWKLGITRPNMEEISFTGESVRNISTLKERLRQQRTTTQTITGNLQAMDFEAHKITILYPENNRELECFYDEQIEPELLETRRGLVQVTGIVVVGEEGIPSKIQAVENIQPLDLSDFSVSEVSCGASVLRFRSPMVLTPQLSDSQQFLMLHHDELDIDVIAQTREELLAELNEQIGLLWKEYALEDDSKLSKTASQLKLRLKEAIEEVFNK